MRIVPKSLMILMEEKPILRISEGNGFVDYELRPSMLLMMAQQALNIAIRIELTEPKPGLYVRNLTAKEVDELGS